MGFTWTDNITTQTEINTQHIAEIQNNVQYVYDNLGCSSECLGDYNDNNVGVDNEYNNGVDTSYNSGENTTEFTTVQSGEDSVVDSDADGTYNSNENETVDSDNKTTVDSDNDSTVDDGYNANINDSDNTTVYTDQYSSVESDMDSFVDSSENVAVDDGEDAVYDNSYKTTIQSDNYSSVDTDDNNIYDSGDNNTIQDSHNSSINSSYNYTDDSDDDNSFNTSYHVPYTLDETVGTMTDGGYYAGIIDSTQTDSTNGIRYKLILAPKADGESSSKLLWGGNGQAVTGADSKWDGYQNTQDIVADSNSHPAAEFCNNLSFNGYSDWYLPAADELELLYRVFKPSTDDNWINAVPLYGQTNGYNPNSDPVEDGYTTSNPSQTSLTDFQQGGTQALEYDFYFTSTEYDASNAWYQGFPDGYQGYDKQYTKQVRAVRRVLI